MVPVKKAQLEGLTQNFGCAYQPKIAVLFLRKNKLTLLQSNCPVIYIIWKYGFHT